MSTNKPPQSRPAIRAVSFDEAGEAIGRLIALAKSDTGQAVRVADFLLAWWNGDDCGHFPIIHLCNVDAVIGEDMVTIMAYLASTSTVYADAWGYGDEMADLYRQHRSRAGSDPD